MADYLDKNGLSHLWGMIKTYVTNAVKVTGVKGNSESSYRTGNVNLTAANVGAFEKVDYAVGTTEAGIRPLVNRTRADRLIFLPADQIIIEQTTDGGTTWTDANISDAVKADLFTENNTTVKIPLLNNAKSTNCGLRITITGMKYDVPSGTAETQKYNYWNKNYILSQERYFNVREWWFWISSNNDLIRPEIYCATGANPNNWVTVFNKDFGMAGWSGSDYIRAGDGKTFGGGTTQTGNYWNWRLIFWSKMQPNQTSFLSATQQSIAQIRCYGDNVWGGNTFAQTDHIYTWNRDKDVTFPAKVTATGGFSGSLTGNASSATTATTATNVSTSGSATNSVARHLWFSDSTTETKRAYSDNLMYTPSTNTVSANITGTVNSHSVNSDVPSNAKFTDTVTTATTTGSGNAVTDVSASNGALTITKGSTFLTTHQNSISGIGSNYTEDGSLCSESANAPQPQSELDLMTHNNIVATSLSAGSTGSVNMYLDLAVYGTCSTAAGTAAKVVSGIKGFALATGSIVAVKFINTNTATPSTLTLNVNSTGAKSIKYRGAAIPSANRLSANRLYWFVYDGTNYEVIGDLDTTYSSMTQAEATEGTIATARLISPAVLKTTIANAVGDAGGGDMTKAVYDTNNNGKVDNADNSVKWNDISTDFQTDYTSILSNDADLMIAGYPYSQYDYNHKPTSLSSILATVTPSTDAIARYDVNSRLHSAAPVATSNDTTVATTAFVNTAIANAQPNITDITSEFTSSNSRIVVRQAYKSGKTISIQFGILRSAAWATGSSNEITSTISSSYLPIHTEYCAHLWGSGAVYGTFDEGDSSQNALLTFRNSSGGSIAASSGNYIYMSFTYIYNDGTLS